MTDRQFSDERLDEAIDRAVRDMMNVEPRPGLRERVLAELNGPPARIALWPRLAFGGAALAVAAVLVALLVSRPPESQNDIRIATSRPTPSTSTANPPSVPTPQPGSTRDTSRKDGEPRPAPPSRVPGPGPRSGAEDRLIQAASIDIVEAPAAAPIATEGLRPLDPIGVASLTPVGVSHSEIDIPAITIEQIDITPLSSRR